MSGYFLILAIIFLGGALATLGDRLGSRVGKARLRLFNLRPKQTATLMTIVTGGIISTLTLGILLGTNRQLRDGLIRIDEIRQRSRQAQAELREAQAQKRAAQAEQQKAEESLNKVVNRLRVVNQSLQASVLKQKRTEAQFRQLQSRFDNAQSILKKTQTQTQQLRQQITRLGSTARQLRAEQDKLIQQRNQAQANLARAESRRSKLEASVRQAQVRLKEVEVQKLALEEAIATAQQELALAKQQEEASQQALEQVERQLEQANRQRQALQADIQVLAGDRQRLEANVRILTRGLRQGNIAIRSGQILASAVISNVETRQEALEELNRLLYSARIQAIVRTNSPDATPSEPIVRMIREDAEQVLSRISDGSSYLVRLLSVNNYLQGEARINVLLLSQVLPNRLLFQEGETVSSISLVPAKLSEEEIIAKVESLFVLAQQRAVEAGIPRDPLTGKVGGEFSTLKLFKFTTALKSLNLSRPVQVYTITQSDVYTAGPLDLVLVAVEDGQVILSSN
ncbi:DUF3084 domain-containing protein [Lyngbya confervoides]|uniref:DUF3084 domain-containing protein n=1 Tax=Lyngbya confervoides BDU141951 TaxID=1574623 RepID=A0ABD4T503_9CYAN|nr:DUF3084 domain-containing protein [Lyngbya confervoides]MCM1983322.1 DUF3084 domain-containing protein [Lyngbya confervoides BDU141951]